MAVIRQHAQSGGGVMSYLGLLFLIVAAGAGFYGLPVFHWRPWGARGPLPLWGVVMIAAWVGFALWWLSGAGRSALF